MYSFTRLLKTSVMKKQLVALTGLGMSAFLVGHMAPNMLIIFSPEGYNRYSHTLISNPLIYVAEGLLVLAFVVHVWLTIQLTLQNRQARPISPALTATAPEKKARFGSRSMILTGLLTFVFVVLHLITFKYGAYYEVNYNGQVMRDIHRLVIEKFRNPLYVVWYLVALALLGIHLSHGVSSLVQTLGLGSVRECRWKKLGYAFAIIVTGGFISQPLYVLLTGK